MPQSKRFGKPFSSLFSVAAFGTRSRENVGAISFLVLAVGGVPTAAQALEIAFKVNNVAVPILVNTVVNTPGIGGVSDFICSTAPCTGLNGKVVILNIPSGIHGTAPNQIEILPGARAEAKIETNATNISTSTSIINTLNVVGTFRYVGTTNPGSMEIMVSSDFKLRDGTTTDLTGGGTWQALGRGASKCEKTTSTGPYQNSLCTISNASVDSANEANDCTLCRSYGYTDTGHVLRPQLVNGINIWQLPATGATVTMTSDVQFRNSAGTIIRTEPLGVTNVAPNLTPGQIGPVTIPAGTTTESGRFYVSLSQNELFPCEPFAEPCQNSERKRSTLRLAGTLKPLDQVVLPATSTDIGGSEAGVVLAHINKLEIPIDVQPIDPVADPQNPGFFIGGVNNDSGQGNSQGNLQVVAFRTAQVNTCDIVPYNGQTPMATLSVAGSPPVPFTGVTQYSIDGVCVGLKFTFDRGAINDAILGNTDADKLQTCFQNPIAVLVIDDSWTVDTTYPLVTPRRTASYEPEAGCEVVSDGANSSVVCHDVTVQVSGSQGVKCATPAGG